MATEKIIPAKKIDGKLSVPGDKSVSHRALMLAALADGDSVIDGLSTAQDVHRTADCLRAMGIEIVADGFATVVRGKGKDGLQQPAKVLDAGNSGTTMRLLSGILAGQRFASTIDGDASLRARPMERIVKPLQQMGAEISTQNGKAPLTIRGGKLAPISYEMTVASAQVKSAVLLAGLFAEGETSVLQPSVSRDHTERLLRHMGVPVSSEKNRIALQAAPLQAGKIVVPGDFSSAIFWMGAAFLLPDSNLSLYNVGLNATRSYALKIMQRAGARLALESIDLHNGEEMADLVVASSQLQAFSISGKEVPLVIDEIPLLAVLASQAEGTSRFEDVGELRIKESDRIHTIVENLQKMGARVREWQDGFEVEGPTKLHGAHLDSHGDHRIAMAFAIAGLVAEGESLIEGAEAAGVSYPEFFQQIEELVTF